MEELRKKERRKGGQEEEGKGSLSSGIKVQFLLTKQAKYLYA